MAAKSTVLITGASGFLGSHTVQAALDAGYRVHAGVRSSKVDLIKARYEKLGVSADVDVFGIDDLVTGDFSAALSGVDGVIHQASPIIGRADAKQTIADAVHGAINVLEQAAKAGVKRAVVTSSFAALYHPAKGTQSPVTYTPNDFSDVTEEEVIKLASNAPFVYSASKGLSERAVWEFAKSHPEIDVTTILPPFLYGPLAPGYEVAKGDINSLSTDGFILQLLHGAGGRDMPQLINSHFVDVREAALAHVLALKSKPESEVGQKRLILSGGSFVWPDVVEYLATARPPLASRLPNPATGSRQARDVTLDTSRTKEVLGFDSYRDWKTTITDTVDSLLKMLATWA
jgi:nucleoside-diphosphate-sugar epimerase